MPKLKSKHFADKKRTNLNGVEQQSNASIVEKQSSPLTVEISTKKVNKLIVKNDTEDEEELRREVERSTTPSRRQKRSNVSPIVFDIVDKEGPPIARKRSSKNDVDDNSSTSPPTKRSKLLLNRSGNSGGGRDEKRSKSHDRPDDQEHRFKEKSGGENHRVNTKRTEVSRKYENLPPCKCQLLNMNWFLIIIII